MGLFDSNRPKIGVRPQVLRVKPMAKPVAPLPLFKQKKDWSRRDLRNVLRKASPHIPGSSGMFSARQRTEMIDKLSPYGKTGSHFNEREAKMMLRNLRTAESKSTTGIERTELRKQRNFLEKHLGLRGKY